MCDLPSEIYQRIFQYLEQEDLQTCYFICKSWYSVAILLNWEKVTLPPHKIILVKSYLNNFNHCQYFKYGHLIEKLKIQDIGFFLRSTQDKFNKLELLALLSQLPNLKEIDLSTTTYFKDYLAFLLDADLQHINKINIGFLELFSDKPFPYSLYFSVCYKFRNSISCMNLIYLGRTIYLNSQQIDVLNSLTQFNKLIELEFCNKQDINLTPFHIQHSCPTLKHLKFESDYPISESAVLHFFGNNNNINLSFITNLSHLELQLPFISAAYTRNLVKFFPNQLVDVCIEISKQAFFNWVHLVGMENALKLVEKVGKVNYASIEFYQNNLNEVRTGEETDMTKYFRFVNAFNGTRPTHCTAFFRGTSDDAEISYSFGHDKNRDLFTAYRVHIDDFRGSNIDLNVPNKNSPEIYNTLHFRFVFMYDSALFQILNYAKLLSFDFKEPSDQKNRDVDFLEISRTYSVQLYLDLVATYWNDVEDIILKTDNWHRSDNNSIINLTGFKKLKNFYYQTFVINSAVNDNHFVLLNYTNGKEKYLYVGARDNDNTQVEYSINPTKRIFTIFCDASVRFSFAQEEYRHILL